MIILTVMIVRIVKGLTKKFWENFGTFLKKFLKKGFSQCKFTVYMEEVFFTFTFVGVETKIKGR